MTITQSYSVPGKIVIITLSFHKHLQRATRCHTNRDQPVAEEIPQTDGQARATVERWGGNLWH